uniref:Glutathione transferase n=1 Tax=Paramoeba aestuarina TaxID=180227 RepID=A0A7S4L3S0_9EUKA|mmetsp:Transcript_30976/g.48277  ORF Transcript_30976/g.48277 Transcript_30976/m.48277 type:complete len:211 (+) Transcript_30976:146-778(+)|eukprot:CAMPEP_0201539996 /NCGR_PEP_ID=MMETSP0161_2-20130828/70699_1 /ASSEMBLY_ACC=CAM_ASM_000251 /TAXON_ID=180227 /ORGANISM="Neoparamoeba aestuarina, Strain SoJaBio B1-5/56/2" /LENGTH=210 /DNA_ID=CAMNT_0047947429 /DNA_START=919 /DNA_END=1551 /DNA_ORIENTATION=-
MAGYTIIYFPARGRAELTRLTIAAAGQEFKEQIVGGDSLVEFKKSDKCLFGQVPVLLDGDNVIAQSNAMARHVARKHKLQGSPDQAVAADMILDHWADILNGIVPLVFGPGADLEKLNAYVKDTLPGKIAGFEQFVKDGGYIRGDSLSFADLALFQAVESLVDNAYISAESHPNLIKHKELVEKNENIAKYLKSETRHGKGVFADAIPKK